MSEVCEPSDPEVTQIVPKCIHGFVWEITEQKYVCTDEQGNKRYEWRETSRKVTTETC